MRAWRQFLRDDDGPTAVEYAVLLGLILIAIIGAIGTVGLQTGGLWGSIDTKIQTQTSGGGS